MPIAAVQHACTGLYTQHYKQRQHPHQPRFRSDQKHSQTEQASNMIHQQHSPLLLQLLLRLLLLQQLSRRVSAVATCGLPPCALSAAPA
jgi:hypothetical protein